MEKKYVITRAIDGEYTIREFALYTADTARAMANDLWLDGMYQESSIYAGIAERVQKSGAPLWELESSVNGVLSLRRELSDTAYRAAMTECSNLARGKTMTIYTNEN